MSSGPLRLLALMVLLASAYAQSVSPRLLRAQEQDRKALLSLKASTMAAGPSRLRVWKDTTMPCGAKPWPYVTCTDGRVTGLNVANLGLAGTLPVDLRKASELVTLNMADNKFVATAAGVTIPDKWVNPQTFRKLKTLNLANNNFIAKLPTFEYTSPARSSLNVWKSLEVLDLSGNKYYGDAPGATGGALPSTWLNGKRVLRSVKILDLSSNALGYRAVDAAGAASSPYSDSNLWCTGATNDGWCPSSTPTPGTLASLEIFDISNNDIKGAIAAKWPVMMPRLTTLSMYGNDFYKSTQIPSPLSDAWSGGSQRGFPALQSLYLYPGNAYICSIPDDNGDYRDVNLQGAYKVLDSADGQWGVENPAICPSSASPVITEPTITKATRVVDIAVSASTDIYGFRLTIAKAENDFNGLEKYVPLSDYTNYYRRVFSDASTGVTAVTLETPANPVDPLTGDKISVTIAAGDYADSTWYKFTVTLIMIDGGLQEQTFEVQSPA